MGVSWVPYFYDSQHLLSSTCQARIMVLSLCVCFQGTHTLSRKSPAPHTLMTYYRNITVQLLYYVVKVAKIAHHIMRGCCIWETHRVLYQKV